MGVCNTNQLHDGAIVYHLYCKPVVLFIVVSRLFTFLLSNTKYLHIKVWLVNTPVIPWTPGMYTTSWPHPLNNMWPIWSVEPRSWSGPSMPPGFIHVHVINLILCESTIFNSRSVIVGRRGGGGGT